nr:RAMP superfamily CRISPR-associated protein [Clostridium aestuarii]
MSEAIFGSGQSVPGSVDLEIVYDEYGLPYLKGKTFKGNLRDEVFKLIRVLEKYYEKKDYFKYGEGLFGKENDGTEGWKKLKFSNCELDKNVRAMLKYGISNKQFSQNDILKALTNDRSFTSIEKDGYAKEGSLRQFRVIKKGLKFKVDLYCEKALNDIELGLLAGGVSTLRHIGTMRTRGKGEILAKLKQIDNDGTNKDITDIYINKLLKEVKNHE